MQIVQNFSMRYLTDVPEAEQAARRYADDFLQTQHVT